MDYVLLTLLVALPVVGGIVIALLPGEERTWPRGLALLTTILVALATLLIGLKVNFAQGGMQLLASLPWFPAYGINYSVGIDGISYAMVALAAIVSIFVVLAAWNQDRARSFYSLLLFLIAGMMGVFISLDFIQFFVFWEVMLLPAYFLIANWGGEGAPAAAKKFLVYTVTGSVFLLVGYLALYYYTGANTFDIGALQHAASQLPLGTQRWLFLMVAAGFAVKIPVVPFHTWLPDTYSEAATPVTMIVAAVMAKTGTYGLLRLAHGMFPQAAASLAIVVAVFGLINLVYGALVALGQDDLKRIIAYSSVSHMGFVLIGLAAGTAVAINGAVFQMVSHGLITAALFFMIAVLYRRTGTRKLSQMRGLYLAGMPTASVLTMVALFANLGLPGLSGFVAEFFTLAGTMSRFPAIVYVAVLGLVIVATFNIWIMQKVFMGPGPGEGQILRDVDSWELTTVIPLVAVSLLIGVLPSILVHLTNSPVQALAAQLGGM